MKKLLITYDVIFTENHRTERGENCTTLTLADDKADDLLEKQGDSLLVRDGACGEVWRALTAACALRGWKYDRFTSAELLESDGSSYAEKLEREQETSLHLRAIIDDLQDKLHESQLDYEAAHEAAHEVADQKDAEIADLKKQIERLRLQVLSEETLGDLATLAKDRENEMEEAIERAAADIVAAADNPYSATFRDAVTRHRAYTQQLKYCRALTTKVQAAEDIAHNINAEA